MMRARVLKLQDLLEQTTLLQFSFTCYPNLKCAVLNISIWITLVDPKSF